MAVIPYAEAFKWLKDNNEIYQMARTQIPDRALELPEARAWLEAMSRCYSPEDPKFLMFGGRAIAMADEWHLFSVFLADMGHAPDGMVGLGRYNLDVAYEPGNCHWLTPEALLTLPKE
jgi:hypothetical protein